LIGYRSSQDRQQHLVVDWAENLDDISYDGQDINTEHNSVGLGQLVDGVITDNRTSINGTFFGQFFQIFFSLFVFKTKKKEKDQ
jgi:hypothetical protein